MCRCRMQTREHMLMLSQPSEPDQLLYLCR